VIARVQGNLKQTLEEMARTAGLPLESFSGQVLDSAAAEFRLLRIPASQDFAPRDAGDEDDKETDRRKPQSALSAAQEADVVRAFISGLRGRELATRFGVSQPTIYRIVARNCPNRPKQIHRRKVAKHENH
jgi:predicted DNA-binding transcriptional regulator AlpA